MVMIVMMMMILMMTIKTRMMIILMIRTLRKRKQSSKNLVNENSESLFLSKACKKDTEVEFNIKYMTSEMKKRRTRIKRKIKDSRLADPKVPPVLGCNV